MANWISTFFEDIVSLWSLKEIRIFVWVLIVGTILYFVLHHLHYAYQNLRKRMKGGYEATKQQIQNRAFMMKKESSQGIRKEKNFEIYREHALWVEKPLWVWKIRQVLFERSIYGIVILLLLILILWRVLK